MDENLRSLVFEGQPLPSSDEAPPTECQITFTITQLPDKLRRNVLQAMVDSANRYLHSLDVFPLPQIEHEVVGLDVPCPNRVYGEVAPYNTARVRTPAPIDAQVLADAAGIAATLRGAARTTVVTAGEPITLYVDRMSGRDDGHGTAISPFRSLRRAQVHARQLRRPTYIRNLSGALMATYGTTGGEDPAPPNTRPMPASPPRQLTRPPVNIVTPPRPGRP